MASAFHILFKSLYKVVCAQIKVNDADLNAFNHKRILKTVDVHRSWYYSVTVVIWHCYEVQRKVLESNRNAQWLKPTRTYG